MGDMKKDFEKKLEEQENKMKAEEKKLKEDFEKKIEEQEKISLFLSNIN